jgi:hypothetical protein
MTDTVLYSDSVSIHGSDEKVGSPHGCPFAAV